MAKHPEMNAKISAYVNVDNGTGRIRGIWDQSNEKAIPVFEQILWPFRDLGDFWQNLAAGRNAIREIPRERWNVDDYFDPDPNQPGKIYCKWLGALDDIDRFDAPFFMISGTQ